LISINEQNIRHQTHFQIAELHLDEAKPLLALEVAEHQELSEELLREVIRANRDQPLRILPIVIRLAEYLVKRANNPSYKAAIALLQEVPSAMDAMQVKMLFAEISRMHGEFRAKRNFRQWLEDAFPELV
jgi:uncharacterized Zn finger protein